jgi:ribonuclease Z
VARFAVTVLGNNAALPAQGRHPTSQILHYHNRNYLLDCGEGTQMQIQRFRVKTGNLDFAFITHLHGDHYYGLLGLVTSMHLNQRKARFRVYAPEGLEEIIHVNLKYSHTELSFPLEIVAVDPTQHKKIGEDGSLDFFSVPLQHRVPCCGYVFVEKPRPTKFKKEMLEQHGVRGVKAIQQLKRGDPFVTGDGQSIQSADFMYPQPQRSYAFLGDTLFHQPVADYVRGVDTLYHESTFTNDESTRAAERFHSTAAQAATIAKEAGVKQLLLGHFSAKYKDTSVFETEARSIFANSIATAEGNTYDIG